MYIQKFFRYSRKKQYPGAKQAIDFELTIIIIIIIATYIPPFPMLKGGLQKDAAKENN